MCGIAGFSNQTNTKNQINEKLLHAMQQSLTHRGPNDSGVWKSDQHQIGFAHRRLSIIDLSPAGRQPMMNSNQSVVVCFNGEIYNHKELRKQLESLGHTYRTETDTETLIHAYEEWGIKFLEKLDGMFAIALFDTKNQELYLIRDRIGIKPLYFSTQGGYLSFASEIKALWQLPWMKRKMSAIAHHHYLTFMVTPAPYTIFEGVYKLPAGMYAKLDAKKNLSFHEWYSPLTSISQAEKKQFNNENFCVENIRELLKVSTKKRMISDVPFGAFLSGGIDSSLNVALMAQEIGKVKTFTVAFSDGPEINELKWARKVAKQFDTDHHEIIISEKEAFEFYEKMIYHNDEPLADPVCIPFYHVAKLAKESGVTV
ncbi:asparagine synthase (glutamine-hydrolyzing), partial [Candidatus Babeliales bacterium]|nr:asparagine synthase (glutamine-hydrolyzing) [Candidatus Babeliales bacterium]